MDNAERSTRAAMQRRSLREYIASRTADHLHGSVPAKGSGSRLSGRETRGVQQDLRALTDCHVADGYTSAIHVDADSHYNRYSNLISIMEDKKGVDMLRNVKSVTLREGFSAVSDLCEYPPRLRCVGVIAPAQLIQTRSCRVPLWTTWSTSPSCPTTRRPTTRSCHPSPRSPSACS